MKESSLSFRSMLDGLKDSAVCVLWSDKSVSQLVGEKIMYFGGLK